LLMVTNDNSVCSSGDLVSQPILLLVLAERTWLTSWWGPLLTEEFICMHINYEKPLLAWRIVHLHWLEDISGSKLPSTASATHASQCHLLS
jgi:hypothetical protein